MTENNKEKSTKVYTAISFIIGILFLIGIGFFLYTNENPSCDQLRAVNFFLALGTASFVIGLPGTLNVNLHPAITGTGAIAAMLLILWHKPMGNIDCYGQSNEIWGQLFVDNQPAVGYSIEINNVQGIDALVSDNKGHFKFTNLNVLMLPPDGIELYIQDPNSNAPYFHIIEKKEYKLKQLIKINLTANTVNVVQYNQKKDQLEVVRTIPIEKPHLTNDSDITESTFTVNTSVWKTSNESTPSEFGSWCLENDKSNCEKYGRLYKWDIAKSICPDGWRLPTRDEWIELMHSIADEDDINNQNYFSKKIFDKLFDKKESLFNAQLAGVKWGEDLPNEFYMNGFRGYYWSSTEIDDEKVYALEVNGEHNRVAIQPFKKEYSMSCRCIRKN